MQDSVINSLFSSLGYTHKQFTFILLAFYDLQDVFKCIL